MADTFSASISRFASGTDAASLKAAEHNTLQSIARYVEEVDKLVLGSPLSACSTAYTIARYVQDVDKLELLSPSRGCSELQADYFGHSEGDLLFLVDDYMSPPPGSELSAHSSVAESLDTVCLELLYDDFMLPPSAFHYEFQVCEDVLEDGFLLPPASVDCFREAPDHFHICGIDDGFMLPHPLIPIEMHAHD